MKQYFSIKAKHPDAILLFRVGDFYETFSDDAIETSRILGITLTKRANGKNSFIELAGFPHHSLDTHLPKIVRAGKRVAICEQLEDPKKTKKIVKRGVVELITPGLNTNIDALENKENNFLASVHIEKEKAGISFLDISTGEFFLTEGNFNYIDKLLNSFQAKEILIKRGKKEIFEELFGKKFYTYPLEDWIFNYETSKEKLLKQFNSNSLKGFGVEKYYMGIIAAGTILEYLDLTHHKKNLHINKISKIKDNKYLWIDKFTIRNLELLQPLHFGGKSLINIIDDTVSPMGARTLRKWLVLPLKNIEKINSRLDVVECLIKDEEISYLLNMHIQLMGDIERMVSKIATEKILPREVVNLKTALNSIEPIKTACGLSENKRLKEISKIFDPCFDIKNKIEREVEKLPNNQIIKGKVIRSGISKELDELREIFFSSKDFLKKLQKKESVKTGISSLKISYNNVFGYYFEVRNLYKNRVPESWIRKQTLVSAERYINDQLKEYESKILGAEEKIFEIESEIFNKLVKELKNYIKIIQRNSNLISELDCLLSFSKIAVKNNYSRPELNDGFEIIIKEGRHPVIEKNLPNGESYFPNDVYLNNNEKQIIVITGPNMSGKSALIRQTALISLMAQMGSFVPAKSVKLGFLDKIFTRVGASDNISLGESTFMVEMNEASNILNNISNRSLILFDELGRGTSTYDGISIAWAIIEFIHNNKNKAKTLFATHYHELNEMEKLFDGIKNYNITVKEIQNKIVFLRKFVEGGSEHSFGIHVAEMSGMPKTVIKRANEILKELESSRGNKNIKIAKNDNFQMSFFKLDDPILEEIRKQIKNLDINNLTPIEALNKLNEIKKLMN